MPKLLPVEITWEKVKTKPKSKLLEFFVYNYLLKPILTGYFSKKDKRYRSSIKTCLNPVFKGILWRKKGIPTKNHCITTTFKNLIFS